MAFLTGPGIGYRHRARLAVRAQAGAPAVGLFERHSHRVVDIARCPIHHANINRAAAWLRTAMVATRVSLYDERRHSGLVRYLQLAVERPTQRVQVVVVANCASAHELAVLSRPLLESAPDFLHSLVFNGHPTRSNAVLGPNWDLLWGQTYLSDTVGGTPVLYPAGAFSQANPQLFDELVTHVREWVPVGHEVVELYCGVGGIGLGLLERAKRVVFNELSPASLEGLNQGLMARSRAEREKAAVVRGDASEALTYVNESSCVIVDPPRKGLDPVVRTGLCERRPFRLIYVSCGFDSFERDAEMFLKAGYRLSALRAAALFPFTDHVELAARFERGDRSAEGDEAPRTRGESPEREDPRGFVSQATETA